MISLLRRERCCSIVCVHFVKPRASSVSSSNDMFNRDNDMSCIELSPGSIPSSYWAINICPGSHVGDLDVSATDLFLLPAFLLLLLLFVVTRFLLLLSFRLFSDPAPTGNAEFVALVVIRVGALSTGGDRIEAPGGSHDAVADVAAADAATSSKSLQKSDSPPPAPPTPPLKSQRSACAPMLGGTCTQ